MRQEHFNLPTYVIKAEELRALNFISPDYPRPQGLEWIDRGTDRLIKPTTIEMLIRTLYRGTASNSVQRLHQRAGLRVMFRSEQDRRQFAAAFKQALAAEQADRVSPSGQRARDVSHTSQSH